MKILPSVPCLDTPFAASGNSLPESDFHDASTDYYEIAYDTGIPITYSSRGSDSKVRFTNREMNRIGFDATAGSFNAQFCCGETFNPEFSRAHGGYPKGAILKWFQFSIAYGSDQVDDSIVPSFDGKWEKLNDSYEKIYHKGDVVYTVKGNSLLWVVTEASVRGDSLSKNLESYAIPFVISSITEVVSTIDNNENDFRLSGPTESNHWISRDSITETVSPDYGKVADDTSIILEGRTSEDAAFQPVTISHDGWIIVNCFREIDDSSFKSIADLIKSFPDGVSGTITQEGRKDSLYSMDHQFGSSDRIVFSMPVCADTVLSMKVNCSFGSEVRVVVRLIGKL